MSKARSEFIIACFIMSGRWDKSSEYERKRFYDEAVKCFGVDVLRQTINELEFDEKMFNVVEYFYDQLPPV